MPVLINFKICDKVEDCGGIEVCPTGAFYWDKKNKTIAIDNSKCVSCGTCEKACPVGAIRFAKNDEEYKKIKKEIDEDSRRISDLFVDRYGAQPLSSTFLVPEDKFNIYVLESSKPTAVELFSKESIDCLIKSIPIRELFRGIDIKYIKTEVSKGSSLLKKYSINSLPSLLIFSDGRVIGKIEGYYNIANKNEIMKKINKILSKI